MTAHHTISATFVAVWTITSSAGANGSITPSGSVSVTNGDSQAYTITADTGYKVASVMVDGVDQGPLTSYTFSNVTAHHTISATFVAVWTITASSGANGSITPSGSVNVTNGAGQAYTIAGNNGYTVASVVVDGVDQGPLTSYTFSNVTANHTISATFIRLWTITSSAGANGSITPSGSVSVINGDSQPFTITPGEGHEVTSVVVDGVDQGPLTSYTFSNVTANHTISATFTALWTITASAGANGSITPSGSISVINGTSQAYTITTNAGYAVTSVMVDGIDQGPLTSYTFTNVTADHTISATFTTLWTITASAGANGSITPSGSISVINGTSQAYMITANTGYAVASVVVDGIDQGPLTSYTFANVTANHTINATFIALWTISASAGTNGSIAPVGNVSVKNGDNQVFTFTPDSGYSIKRITVDGQEVTAAGSYIFANVTGNHTIAVVFLSNKNQPPDKPSLISPIDNVLLPEGPVELKSGPFSDPDGDDHILSRWQIRRGDDKAYFYDESSNEDLTEHTVSLNLDYGMQYFWRVGYVDSGKEQITWSDEASFVIGEPAVNKEAPPVQPGVAVSAYRMVSFVQFPKHPSAKAVFGPLMGSGYDMGDYRIGIYDPAINSYHEYPDFDVVPGRAYWFLARNGMNFSVEGVPVSMTMDIYVPLLFNPVNKNGWNMIACPNKASYYWGDIEIVVKDDEGTIIYGPMPVRNLTADNGYIDKRIWVWKNGAYSVGSETLKMTPYNGYWVKAKAAGVSLVFPSGMQVALRNPDVMISGLVQSGSEWLHQKISPANAFADYDADSPPMPMPGLQSSASGTTGGSSGGGCFIFTIDGAKDQ